MTWVWSGRSATSGALPGNRSHRHPGADHPAWRSTGAASPSASTLRKAPFIYREQGSETRKVIAQALEAKGCKETDLDQVAQFGSNEAVKEAVKAGVGVSMLSRRSVAEDLQRGTLVALSLADLSGERPFYLVTRKSRALQPSVSTFASHLCGQQPRARRSSFQHRLAALPAQFPGRAAVLPVCEPPQ